MFFYGQLKIFNKCKTHYQYKIVTSFTEKRFAEISFIASVLAIDAFLGTMIVVAVPQKLTVCTYFDKLLIYVNSLLMYA